MPLKSFNLRISKAFDDPNLETRLLKSALIGLCSDCDRQFRLALGIDIYREIDEDDFTNIKRFFPNFRSLTLEQFNQLLYTFIAIRDVSAHLYLKKAIFIDQFVIDLICNIIEPKYELSHGKEITIFGAICVVLLFSQTYELWTFVNTAIRNTIFQEVPKNMIAECQRDFQSSVRKLAGNLRPCRPHESSFVSSDNITVFVEEVKKASTALIFDLERHSMEWPSSLKRVPKTVTYLKRYECLKNKPELIKRIVEFRNNWVHGFRLFDYMYDSEGNEQLFDFEYLFTLLKDIKDAFANSPAKTILNDINEFGKNMIDFYLLRLLEVSFKIIVKRVFDIEKIEDRVSASLKAFNRAMRTPAWFYEDAMALLKSGKKEWYLKGSKFLDFINRSFSSNKINVFELTSKNGFDIGDTHVDSNVLVIADMHCPLEYQLKINGKYFNEYITESPETYGIIDIHRVEI